MEESKRLSEEPERHLQEDMKVEMHHFLGREAHSPASEQQPRTAPHPNEHPSWPGAPPTDPQAAADTGPEPRKESG